MAMGRSRGSVAGLGLGLVAACFVLGCEALSYYPEDCADEAACPGSACPGQCVPLPPLGFEGPVLLWSGPEAEAPGCPARAPTVAYEGHAELLEADKECPPCACTAPACVLPEGVTASNTSMCQGPQLIPFDAPGGWGGACAAAAAVIEANELRSIEIAPVTVRGCEVVAQPVPQGPEAARWGVFARACRGEAVDTVCDDPGKTCLPSAEPPPPGFRQCIGYVGSAEPRCPGEYPEAVRFYGGVDDARVCGECVCTEMGASQCEAWLSLFRDSSCGTGLLSTAVGPGMASCQEIQLAGATLGSMSASWVTNAPGSCVASSGAPTGAITPANPQYFCCQAGPGG